MFYLESNNKADCCGCRGCEQICPTNCISMREDEEGFKYPVKFEASCIHCELCKKVCPNVNKDNITKSDEYDVDSEAYLAVQHDEAILDKSASGGVFSAIVDAFCEENSAVFGVEFDDNLNVIHSYIEGTKDINKYRKSKYVQSDIRHTYEEAEKLLKQGKKVLFTGTPCQIGGLKLYLRKEYHNLFCADLVCHGVPSQMIFDKYIECLQAKYKGKVSSYGFRHKTYTAKNGWNSKNIKVNIGKKIIVKNSQEDTYLRGYHSELFYRPSCYKCKYANPERVSDITMADFWGVEKIFPEEQLHKGVSVFLVNTKKGHELVDKLAKTMRIEPVEKEFVIRSIGQLNKAATLHPKRELFFRVLETQDFDKAIEQSIPNPKPSLIKRILSKIFPNKVKVLIRKIIN